ncbi:MAG: glutaredoxin 3 [Gammaproteobacteria bacterium]
MPSILIYTSTICPYCIMAKRLLDNKGIGYREINVDAQPGLREKMMEITARRTVPQIFIGDRHIGGFDELYALEVRGELNGLVTAAAEAVKP